MPFALKTLLLAAALPLIGIGALQAADAPKPAASQSCGTQPMKVSTSDYIKKAALGDMFEIESSRIAAAKATNRKVKDFAGKMVKDHGNSTDKLKATLTKAKADEQPPSEMDAAHKAKLEKLRAVSGPGFDRMYIQEQHAAHREAWELHNGYAKTGDNNELKKTAGDIAKTVQAHLKDLENIQKDDANRTTPPTR